MRDDAGDGTGPPPGAMDRAGGRRLVLILGALTAFTPLAVDMYLPALPAMARQLAAGDGAVQLTLASFFLGIAIGQLFYGPISDRVGRKPPLYFGIVTFVIASAACALAPNVEALVALRFVQALGGCAGIVISRAIVRDLFQPQQAARVFSYLMLVMGVAPILAPLAGGYVVLWSGWPAIFWGLAAFGALVMLAVPGLPETRLGAAAPALGLASALNAYRVVLTDRHFLAYALANGLPMAGMFAYIAGSPFVFIELYGVPAQDFGWFFGANAFGLIGASQINRRLLARHPATRILAWAGMAAAGAGLVLLADALTGFAGLWGIAVPLFFCIAPLGMVMPNAAAASLAGHGERAGTAAAMLGILQFAGGGISSTAVSALHAASALPMAAIVAGCMLAGVLARRALAGPVA